MKKVSVSFLGMKNQQRAVERLEISNTDYIHVDVMDGRFVKGRNNPYKLLTKMSKTISKRLDVHLMDKNPLKNINYYASLNTEYISVHVELPLVEKYLDLIKEYGIKCGLAIRPETDISILLPYLSKVDLILVMSVNPGKSGQSFIEDTKEKVFKIKKLITSKKLKTKISVDGGVNDETVKQISDADIIISGSYVFGAEDLNERINILKKEIKPKKKVSE